MEESLHTWRDYCLACHSYRASRNRHRSLPERGTCHGPRHHGIDWFTLFQNHWFIGLRNLGFLNIVGAALLAPTILAVYAALRRDNEAYAAFGAILFFVGIAAYLSGNRAFPMLSLSHQYASATSDAQRSLLAAAGQAMLAEGESRAGILLTEFACLVISAVMLKGKAFSKATASTGMLGNALLMVVEIVFVPVSSSLGMIVAASAGILLLIWYVLVGRTLLEFGRTLGN